MLIQFPDSSKIWIYVLLLDNKMYYVGQSINPEARLKSHSKGKLGSEWTKKHKPIKLIQKIKTEYTQTEDALKLENSTTVEYMKRYGWRNVRGGDYCTLDEEKLRFLLVLNTDIGKDLLPLEIPQELHYYDKEWCFFALRLEEENYFIGRTNNLKLALLKECTGLGSEWTKIYRPLNLLETSLINLSNKKEIRILHNSYVISYMKKYGFQKIRGGDFYNPDPRNHKNKVLNYTDIFK